MAVCQKFASGVKATGFLLCVKNEFAKFYLLY